MATYVLRPNWENYPAGERTIPKWAAAPDPRVHVISDTMPTILSHADGLRYDSKRNYERGVRRAGCEIIGNEKLPERKPIDPGPVGPDVRAAIEQLRSR